ncbi:MAG: SDR family NAD(P)-dependent oxidoreductase [Planctomycetota bacterium]
MKLPADRLDQIRALVGGRSFCVTGGAGFIGAHIVDTLIAAGAAVTVIDDLSNATLDTLTDHIELDGGRCRFVYGSILDDRALDDAIQGADAVLHLAAMGSVPRSFDEPARAFAVNATGTLRVLETARHHGCRRVVLAASSSAYGNPAEMPCVETMPTDPLSPYAASKLAAESLCRAWSAGFGLSTACLRYFNVFGPRQRHDSAYAAAVAAFAGRLTTGRPPVIFGDGQQVRDFTYVANAVVATILAATADAPLAGEPINIGSGGSVSVAELARMMSDRLAPNAPAPVFEPARPGDVKESRASSERARELIGYEPVMAFQDGLDQTCDWYRLSVAEGSSA